MTSQHSAIHEVFAYLRVSSTEAALQFYAKAFGAVERFRLTERLRVFRACPSNMPKGGRSRRKAQP